MTVEIPAALVSGGDIEVDEPIGPARGLRAFVGRLLSWS
jgi:hypothetical protein